jgi:hypothetical protein
MGLDFQPRAGETQEVSVESPSTLRLAFQRWRLR